MDISLHDNRIMSYSVLCEARELRLQTAYLDQLPYEYTDVVFSGVEAYHFESDSFDTILFDIVETTPERVLAEYRSLFSRLKNYGWPAVRYNTEQDLLE